MPAALKRLTLAERREGTRSGKSTTDEHNELPSCSENGQRLLESCSGSRMLVGATRRPAAWERASRLRAAHRTARTRRIALLHRCSLKLAPGRPFLPSGRQVRRESVQPALFNARSPNLMSTPGGGGLWFLLEGGVGDGGSTGVATQALLNRGLENHISCCHCSASWPSHA